jgi:hypothetical protein
MYIGAVAPDPHQLRAQRKRSRRIPADSVGGVERFLERFFCQTGRSILHVDLDSLGQGFTCILL